MTDFNGTVGSDAIKHITGMGNLAVIDDNTDSMHTGIIQYLNAAAAGNHVVDGMTITQSDGGDYTTFTVSAGSYFKNHVLQSFSQAAVSLSNSFDPAAYTYYIFLVVSSSGSLALRGNESDGASETDVGNLSDGDIPIALIEINKSSAADAADRKIQYYGATAKSRGFSVTNSSGNEVLQLKPDGTLVNSGGTLTLPSATDTLVGRATTDTLTNKTLTTPIIATIKADSDSSHTVPNVASDTFALLAATQTLTNKTLTSPTITGTGAIAGTFTGNLTGNVTGNLTGNVTGNADTATTANTATTVTNVTVSANNSTDETVFPLFVDGATGQQGAETDTGFTYNPSTGMLTATGFTGALTGNADTATSATQLANARDFSITGDITANAISFDGTGAVALSATIDNNSVALGTKTTGSYVAQGATSGDGISGSVNTEGGTFTVQSNATSANTASTIVFRDSNGDFNAGTISAALTGNVTGNVTGTVSSLSNHDTGDLAEGTNKYLTLANLKSQLNASMPSNALTIGDSDDTITIPGSLVVTGTTTTASVETVSTSNGVVFEGSTADNNETTLVGGNPSGDITITLPTTAGTVALTTSDISGNAATATQWANARTITLGTDLSGSVSIDGTGDVTLNATIAADSVALGTDTTGNYVASITNGSFLTGGNGGSEGAALTLAVDATNLNTASKVVARDSSGNFSAGTITATLSGNASTATQAANLNNHDTGDLSEGSNLYHTTERVQDVVGGQFVTNGSHTNITAAYDDSGDGAIDLSITDGTIRGKISVTDSGGDGSLAYNNSTGVITYTGPSASDVRAHFSAGTGVGISSGEISIGQAVATNSNVQFGTITGTTITGSSIVKSGGSSSEFLKADGSVDSSTYLTAHPSISAASNVSASTATFIDGLTFDSNGHVTATSTSTALVGVTDGNLIDTSTTNGNVTIAVDLSELADMTQSVDSTQDELVILDNGSQKRKLISEIPISSFNNDGSALNPANFSEKSSFDHTGGAVTNEDTFIIADTAASNAGKRILAGNIPLSAFNNDSGFTTNTGDITAIVSGTALTGGNTSGSVTLNVDLSDLTTSTSDGDGDFFIVVDSSNAQKKLTKGNINLSGFNNDSGFLTAHPNISAASSSDNSGRTYIQDLTLDSNGHVTGIATATETVTNTNQLTTFNIGVDTNTNATTIAHNETLTFTGGTGISTETTADGTVTITNDSPHVATNLGSTTATGQITITSSTGNNVVIGEATGSIAGLMSTTHHDKLDGIEASADVTDTANVTAAGALMDSEVSNLAFVKGLTSGISDGNVLVADSNVADDDFLRVAGTSIEGRSATEVRSDLGLGAAALKAVATDGTSGVANGESGLVTGNAVFDYIAAQNFASAGASNFVVGDITGQAELTSGLASTDELVLSDGGSLARMDISVLQAYMQSNLTFTTNTDTQLSTEQVQDIAGGMFSSNTETGITATYQDADGTIDLVVGTLNQDTTGNADTATLATTVTVSDSTANTNFPVVFHNESNGLLDDTGALRYNPSTGTLLVPNLNVAGTTTTVNTVTMEAANAVVFEGATSDDFETTLTITDPTADRTITLPDASGTVAVSAGTGIDLSAAGAVSVDVSDFMTNGSNNRILTATGTDAMNAEANLTFDGSTLAVTGALTATTKSFDIEHPTKKGMRLHHGSLEGPEHGVYIRGRLEGNEIDLPDYWLGLVDEDTITVQLTPNKGFQQIYVEDISDNKVYVGTQSDKPIDCFYFIQAERKDIDRMEVEY